MKYSLLQLTQNILSSLNSDEVNSISDTTESMQVAEMIRTSYFNMLGRFNLPENNQLLQLTASGDVSKPTLMYVPNGINRIEWIKYLDTNISNPSFGPGYTDVKIISIDDFLRQTNTFNSTEPYIDTFTLVVTNEATGSIDNFTIQYRNDQQPRYCTIISNHYVLFDSYDSTQDTTLQNTKTMCFGWVSPSFTMSDSFTPALDERQFPMLLNEAKSLAFLELKQMAHPKAEREVTRLSTDIQKYKAVTERPTSFEKLPDFGRRR